MNTRDCPCAQWCVTYGIMPGEYHHRNCKHWHRDMEAVQTKTEIIVLGTPESDDETHNCDAMGCSSVSHVLFRLPLAHHTPSTTVEAHPNPTHVWAAISKTLLLLFANEKDARAMQPTATSAFDIQRHTVYGTPPKVEPAPNPWKDAVLDQLASHAMDAPIDMPPADILKRVIDMAVTMETDPAISEPAPSTAGELASKTAMLAKTTAWLDGMGGAIHTYSSRGIALAGFERGWEAALLQSTADHIAEQRKLVAAMPVVQLTHPTADMQIAGGAVELDYTGVQTAPNTVGWLTAARVWLAMERASTQPKRLTFEALNAAREAHQNKRTDDYFEARPQIDNTDRRRVFENGYKRGFDDGMVFQRDQGAA